MHYAMEYNYVRVLIFLLVRHMHRSILCLLFLGMEERGYSFCLLFLQCISNDPAIINRHNKGTQVKWHKYCCTPLYLKCSRGFPLGRQDYKKTNFLSLFKILSSGPWLEVALKSLLPKE